LGHHSSINNVLVLACDDHSGSKYLVAYILPDSKNIPSPEELKSFLKNDLPDYMIPSFFVMMDEFPLTSNGKINRKALPAPEYGRLDNVEYTPPQTTTEKSLATIWSDVLHLEQIGVHDNFFELGGHSLLATRVIYRVQAELHIELSLRSLFENPTIAGLVLQVDQELNEGAGQSLQPIPTVSREGLLPLSFAQQRLWFLNEYEPNSPLYNIPLKLSLSGSLDHAALEQSLNEIISRHESLRTTFDVIDGNPVQVIHSPSDRVLQIEDLSDIPEKEQGQKVHSLARAEADTPFDLKLGPLFRYRLLRLGDNRHILLLNMHHIISDGWSLDVLMNELSVCYTALANGNIPELPPLPVQYVDFANWQQNWLDGENLENQLSYWKNKLGSDVPVLELPTDHPHPTLQTYQGAIEMTTLNKELVTPLRQLSHQEDVTLFMASLAIFKILLSRYSGQDDIVVGSPIANRTRKEIEPLIGFFVNTLVLRTDMPGHLTYRDLLKQVRDTTLDAYANQDIPFEKLVEEFRSDRDLSRTPLFQVMFVLQNTQDRQIKLSGLHVACDEIYNETAKFDLTMTLEDNGDELNLSIEYNTDLFEPATIRRMLGHYQILLAGIIANPECPISQLPLLGEAEQKQILVDWNDTAKDYPQDKCVHELFEAQVKRTPDATAVIFEDQSLTYAQLNEQANQLARHLKKLGVKPDVSVALCMDRSLELLVGLLGILKAGGAYVPLDPAYPSERLAFMLADTAAPVLLTQGYLLNNLPENNAHIICLDTEWKTMEVESPDNLTHQTNPDNLAYIIYTSGSTGQPKGVEIPHRGVVRLVFGTDYITFNASQTFLQLAPVSFDASTFELWGALLHGARCVLYPERVPDLDNLGEALKTYNIDCLWLTASLFNLIIDEKPGILSGISQLLTGGEALSVNHIKKAEALLPATQIINGYGPTESTTFTCCYRIPRQLNNNLASIPIGRAISNTQVYILDPHLNPVPIGVPGELYIGGAGLARGYLHQEELTREKFIDNPHNQGSAPRLYKTGDRCRYLPDGNIEFLGRLDHQVKIRGFRIELGEIESVLEQHPSVQQVVADVKEKIKDHKQLVAYIVSDGDPVSPEALRDYLKEKCPEYMIPSLFIAMKSLPLTPNGKIDRNALPEPTENPSNQPEYLSPLSATEQALAAIWAELLHVKQVGRNDNFFELGGHSLLAVKLFYHIQKNFDKTMPLTVLFKAPTVKQLAEKIRESGASVPTATSVLIKPGDSGSPLFFLPGAGGHAFTFYDLAYRMDLDRPVYGLQLRGLDGKQSPHESMKDMAAYFIKEIQNIQPMGPYYLGGYSLGGRIAFEMAQQLQKQGQKVAWLAMIGSSAPGDLRSSRSAVMRKLLSIKAFLCLNYKDKLRYLLFKYKCERNKLKNKINEAVVRKEATDEYALLKNFKEVKKCALEAWYNYNAEVYHGNMTLFRETEFTSYLEKVYDDPKSGWEKYIAGTLDVHEIHCQHLEMFKTPHIEVLAKKLKASILKAGLTDSVETIPSSSQYQSQCHKTREGSWPVKPETIRLNGDDVHVYCADLTDDSLPLHDYEEMLSADERQRASRYHLETDRTHFIARRAILRKLLGHYLDVEPKDVKIKTTKEGKPILADHNGISSLNFSMASSNGRVVYAFAHDRAIGIDIEYIQPETEHEKLAQKFFAPQEISSLQSLPDDQRSRAFYHCWTMKEAYIKAKGIVPLDQFVVAFPPATPPAILTAQGQTVHADQWTCKTVDVNARWASSLVAKGNRSTIKYWAVQK
ncbi:MAG: amino acid adenylation domain-containing protein, partial [Phycisphaerae bacterium]|nr:amino acid adenylation domain-containing protein [Phycisphaerae bacterium]